MKALKLNGADVALCENKTEPEAYARLGISLGTFFGADSTVIVGCENDGDALLSAMLGV